MDREFFGNTKRYNENFMPPLTKFKAAWLKNLETHYLILRRVVI